MRLNWDKITRIALVVAIILLIAVSGYTLFLSNQYHEQNIALTAKDAELQQANLDIGLSKSKLVKGRELEKDLRTKIRGMEDEFQKLVREHELKIKSNDQTIIALRNQLVGGTTTVVIHDGPDTGTITELPEECREYQACKAIEDSRISYKWQDPLERFSLIDPNIWVKGDEQFTSSQYFKIEGFVFESKEGQLQTRKVSVKEVDKDGKEIPGATTEVVEANFTYTNRSVENRRAGILDVITLRPYASFDTTFQPGFGLELLNLGRFIPYANIGVGPSISFDVSDVLGGSLQRGRLGLSAQYHLVPPIFDTNIAIGMGVGVPFNNLSSPVFSVSLIFYLTPDLNPFSFWKDRPEILGIKL